MPFKDPEKKRQYYIKRKRAYDAEWKRKNKEKWNEYQKEQSANRRANGKQKAYYQKIKSNPEQYKKSIEATQRYRRLNIEILREKDRNQSKNLSNRYLMKLLQQQLGLSFRTLKQMPRVMEAKKLTLKIKRHANSD